MKKLWIITMVLILSLLLTSCQPTPETPVVVGKGDGRLEDKIIDSTQNTSAPEGKVLDFGTPEKYTDEFSNNSGKLTVHVDAPITVPQVSSLPVIKVSPRTITQEEADTLVSLLFQGKPLLATDNEKVLTVQDLQNLIIQNKAAAATEKDSAQKQRILDAIAELEAQLKTAPRSIESGESTTTLQGSGGQTGIDIFCNLGNLNPANICINNTAESRALASFYNGSKINYMDILRPESQTNGLKITLEEAQKEADAAVKKLDPDGQYALSTYGIAWKDDRSIESNEQADIDNAAKAYVFEYMRQVSGIPATYTMIECANVTSLDDTFTNPLSYERIQVQVDENGIAALEWVSPMKQGETMTQNVQILSFKQVQEIFSKMIKIRYSFVDETNPNYTVESCDVYVTRVVLGYTRIASKDNPDEFMMVPVWDFFGYDVQNIPEIPLTGNQDRMEYINSLVTINAIDGSIIDRGFGY